METTEQVRGDARFDLEKTVSLSVALNATLQVGDDTVNSFASTYQFVLKPLEFSACQAHLFRMIQQQSQRSNAALVEEMRLAREGQHRSQAPISIQIEIDSSNDTASSRHDSGELVFLMLKCRTEALTDHIIVWSINEEELPTPLTEFAVSPNGHIRFVCGGLYQANVTISHHNIDK